ncbi:MAG: hypothetical protein JXA74_02725 [Anaerolineae bacterium]|nr:hypothetical protein [Anaerolineae bacterium]
MPCTGCDLAFADGLYHLVDLNVAAWILKRDADEFSSFLWAGGTLADAVREQGGDLRSVRGAVHAERHRALANSDYLRDARPELCCEGDCCPGSCVGEACGCVPACRLEIVFASRR